MFEVDLDYEPDRDEIAEMAQSIEDRLGDLGVGATVTWKEGR